MTSILFFVPRCSVGTAKVIFFSSVVDWISKIHSMTCIFFVPWWPIGTAKVIFFLGGWLDQQKPFDDKYFFFLFLGGPLEQQNPHDDQCFFLCGP